MKELINELGQKNITIICIIIILIIVALIVLMIIEKSQEKKKAKEELHNVLPYIENKSCIESNNNLSNVSSSSDNSNIEKDVFYVSKKETPESAKKAIEDAAKKLAYEDKSDLVGPTYFEKEQEENSIISYDELIKKDIDVDSANDLLLKDEGNEPITIDELYKSNNNIDDIEEQSFDYQNEEIIIPKIKEDIEVKKFKNSEVISPVFGIKKPIDYKEKYNKPQEQNNINNLDVEITKTEELLTELKKLKDKLD